MSRKPRSDSKLDNLPESRVLELRDGLLGGWRYEDALSWLETECDVSSSMAALSGFFKRHCKPVLKQRRQLAALKAEVLVEEAGKTDWDAAILEDVKQMVFEFMQDPNADFEKTEKLLRLVLKSRDQDMTERRVKLLEAAARKAEEAEAVTGDGKLSAEEKDARMREIFGLG
ncbi:hypothetical protein ACFPK9_01200 [Rubritalea spongiae]|uniref:DUF3486 family protein n=1 Tax=Rubritalea spongiae TaxID=430797 RepID=A0ABW5DYR0_9BACT